MFKKSILSVLVIALTCSCASLNNDDSQAVTHRDGDMPLNSTIKVGFLADTQGTGGNSIAFNQMKAILDFYRENGVTHVIAVGDVTTGATVNEYKHWVKIAREFKDSMIFLPLAGNHETDGNIELFPKYMKEFITDSISDKQLVQMPGYEDQSYAVTAGNTLMIQFSNQTFQKGYEWGKSLIENRSNEIEHIFVSAHSPILGPYRGGRLYEKLSKPEELAIIEKWRALMITHNVTFFSGHDHMYGRSVIWDKDANNNRKNAPFFHHIVTGNASEKSYWSRMGEFEQAQSQVMWRTTRKRGKNVTKNARPEWTKADIKRDVMSPGTVQINASWIEVTGNKVDYKAFYDDWVATTELLDGGADWKLFDRFVQYNDHCDTVIFPSSAPQANVNNNYIQNQYITDSCRSPSGASGKLIGGSNEIFNRVDQALAGAVYMSKKSPSKDYIANLTQLMKIVPEFTDGAENGSASEYRVNGDFPINDSHPKGFEVSKDGDLTWFPHTTDMKKLVSLSWSSKHKNTISEVLTISGIQGQTGVYSNPLGYMLDIAKDKGYPGSAIDNSSPSENLSVMRKQPLNAAILDAKSPARLHITDNMKLDEDLRNGVVRADTYVFEMTIPTGMKAEELVLAHLSVNNQWIPLINDYACISTEAFNIELITTLPADIASNISCNMPTVVSSNQDRFWARVDFEGQFALVKR